MSALGCCTETQQLQHQAVRYAVTTPVIRKGYSFASRSAATLLWLVFCLHLTPEDRLPTAGALFALTIPLCRL